MEQYNRTTMLYLEQAREIFAHIPKETGAVYSSSSLATEGPKLMLRRTEDPLWIQSIFLATLNEHTENTDIIRVAVDLQSVTTPETAFRQMTISALRKDGMSMVLDYIDGDENPQGSAMFSVLMNPDYPMAYFSIQNTQEGEHISLTMEEWHDETIRHQMYDAYTKNWDVTLTRADVLLTQMFNIITACIEQGHAQRTFDKVLEVAHPNLPADKFLQHHVTS